MPNQRDVAKEAGVSSATVSRYLNNPESISKNIAEKVRKAIEKLSYRLDYSAQTLKTGRYYRIGIIAASIGPFYMEVLRNIEDILSKNGYFINISFSRYHDSSERKTVDLIKSKQADGFLFFPRLTKDDDQIIEYLKNYDEKFVIIDRYMVNKDIFQIRIDNYNAGRKAASVFLEKGHTDFLFIWGHEDISSSHERFSGFFDELKKSGIELSEDRQIYGEFSADFTYSYIKTVYKNLPKFTAVFASNDLSAIGFMRALSEFGKKVKQDYSIIGFDDDVFSNYLNPSLSSFKQPLKEMGIKAAMMLIDQIEEKEASEKIISLNAEYIERESV